MPHAFLKNTQHKVWSSTGVHLNLSFDDSGGANDDNNSG
jgi:hypothetical protein